VLLDGGHFGILPGFGNFELALDKRVDFFVLAVTTCSVYLVLFVVFRGDI